MSNDTGFPVKQKHLFFGKRMAAGKRKFSEMRREMKRKGKERKRKEEREKKRQGSIWNLKKKKKKWN